MPRDLPVGNGSLLLNFDKSYNLRDIYWPHVGQELHTGGDISHTGVWVDGQFAWLDASEWQRELVYEPETLVTNVTLTHAGLQLQLVFNDVVDFTRAIFLRHVLVKNQANTSRNVRLFFHYDWYIWNDVTANTVFYYPVQQALVAYKLSAYFLMNGAVRDGNDLAFGISSWATGVKEFQGKQRTHSLASGVMAEQVHPFTSEPLSVSPLTWSHAEYILTVRWYLGKYRRFHIGP